MPWDRTINTKQHATGTRTNKTKQHATGQTNSMPEDGQTKNEQKGQTLSHIYPYGY